MDKLTIISGCLFLAADIFAIASIANPDWINTGESAGALTVGLVRQCQTLHGRDRTCIPPRLPPEWVTTLFFIIMGIISLTVTCGLLVASHWRREATKYARWIAFTGMILFCMAALIFPIGFYINEVGGQPYKLPNNTVVGSSYVLFVLAIFFTIDLTYSSCDVHFLWRESQRAVALQNKIKGMCPGMMGDALISVMQEVIILVDVSVTNSMYIIHIQHSLRLLLEQQMTNQECFNITAMKRNGTACQVDRFTSSYKAEANGSVCRTQGNGHPCTNETKSSASTKHSFNRVVPRWSKAADCTGNRCVGSLNGTRTVTALVTGGGGYFGYRLGCALVRCGISVILLDLHKPKWDIPEGAVFLQSDIRDYGALYKVCDGVGCVFHVASYGMSGPEQLKKAQIESVNVGGTNNVIRVCTQRNITRLIYTSTVNVVFEGSPIEQGDEETVPYVPLDKHVDQYSKTKAIADQMVLGANGTPLKGGTTLRTCVLRPPGIYGPEEWRHLQRVAVNIERRLFSFSFGNRHAKMNWVHIDNLVQAHLLAAEALTAGKGYIASGQIYYINDGESVNLFEWLTPLHVGQYSKTKAIADQMVLGANGTPLKGGTTLRTCVLRPPGIYGPEEWRHLQRVAVNIERRLFSFSFGNRHAKMNWVHIDNLVQAHLLAAEALTAGKGYIASGQIYYINDGESVNLFEWLTPLFEKLGHSRPLIHLPVSLVYTAAILMECLHVALRPVIEIPLLLTRNEVRNIAVTHTFKIDKARRQLGFCPKQYSFTDSVDFYMESRAEEQSFLSVCLKATLIIWSLLALLFLSCFWDDLSILKTSNETGH
ncbi:UNVERIFIED_CONTAM: hypothetical protein FKN15_042037 [Acipenser sinensis]